MHRLLESQMVQISTRHTSSHCFSSWFISKPTAPPNTASANIVFSQSGKVQLVWSHVVIRSSHAVTMLANDQSWIWILYLNFIQRLVEKKNMLHLQNIYCDVGYGNVSPQVISNESSLWSLLSRWSKDSDALRALNSKDKLQFQSFQIHDKIPSVDKAPPHKILHC